MGGWIKVYRKLQECPIWYGERFSKGQAWVDLLMLTNHSDKKIMFNGEFITVKRGQYLTSMVKLSEKWKWNRKTVSSFLKLLENDNMITKVTDNTKTLITIVNYGIYQSEDETIGQPITHPNGQHTGQLIGQPIGQQRDNPMDNPLDTNKNDKNIKNEKKEEIREWSSRVESRFNEFCQLYPKKVANILSVNGEYAYVLQTTPPLTEDDLILAVKNYAEACRILKTNERYIKNPENWLKDSTWINYLPENYKKPEGEKAKNKFNQFQQNDYDFEQLENELLGNGG